MAAEPLLFAGVSILSGRMPISFAALDGSLEVVQLAQLESAGVIGCLQDYESARLAINIPGAKGGREIYADLQQRISQAGFHHYSEKNSTRLWIGSNADECYRVFQPGLLSRRTLEGRIQRGLILYEEGLRVKDAMDFFEEITRYKLMQGVLPLEYIYSPGQLDALMMAYVSWLAGHPSERVTLKGDLLLPSPE